MMSRCASAESRWMSGTKGSAGLLNFVSPDGEPVVYYGVKFTGVPK